MHQMQVFSVPNTSNTKHEQCIHNTIICFRLVNEGDAVESKEGLIKLMASVKAEEDQVKGVTNWAVKFNLIDGKKVKRARRTGPGT